MRASEAPAGWTWRVVTVEGVEHLVPAADGPLVRSLCGRRFDLRRAERLEAPPLLRCYACKRSGERR